MTFPPPPRAPSDARADGAYRLRYEDVVQDGRLRLTAMAPSLGVVWRALIGHHETYRALERQGVLPILTRLHIVRRGGPLSVMAPVEAAGRFALAHDVDEATGEARWLFLNMWTSVYAPAGLTRGAQPANAGERVLAGELFAEHTMTRPFAPPGQRRVTRLEVPGLPAVPPDRHRRGHAADCLRTPAGASDVDPAWVPATAPTVFGLDHTDANQHVNSLAYPQLFCDEALRRFAARGLPTRVTARELDIRFRKPSFAGEQLRVATRAFVVDGQPGVVAGLFDEAALADPAAARPRCCAQIRFEA